jgi:hypothetical protein
MQLENFTLLRKRDQQAHAYLPAPSSGLLETSQAPGASICGTCELRGTMATDRLDLEAQFPGPHDGTVKAEVVDASINAAKWAAQAKHQHVGEEEFQDRLRQATVKYNEV